jgi:hypothetical protein
MSNKLPNLEESEDVNIKELFQSLVRNPVVVDEENSDLVIPKQGKKLQLVEGFILQAKKTQDNIIKNANPTETNMNLNELHGNLKKIIPVLFDEKELAPFDKTKHLNAAQANVKAKVNKGNNAEAKALSDNIESLNYQLVLSNADSTERKAFGKASDSMLDLIKKLGELESLTNDFEDSKKIYQRYTESYKKIRADVESEKTYFEQNKELYKNHKEYCDNHMNIFYCTQYSIEKILNHLNNRLLLLQSQAIPAKTIKDLLELTKKDTDKYQSILTANKKEEQIVKARESLEGGSYSKTLVTNYYDKSDQYKLTYPGFNDTEIFTRLNQTSFQYDKFQIASPNLNFTTIPLSQNETENETSLQYNNYPLPPLEDKDVEKIITDMEKYLSPKNFASFKSSKTAITGRDMDFDSDFEKCNELYQYYLQLNGDISENGDL